MIRKTVIKGLMLLCAVCLCARAFGEPPTISIQGKLEKSNGSALTGVRAYRVRFYTAFTGGSQLGSDLTGLVSVPLSGRFSIVLTPPTQILNQNSVFYELAIDSGPGINGDGSIDAVDVFPNRIQVNSVPFARNSGQLGGVAASSYVKTTDLTTNSTTTLGGNQFWRLGGDTITNGATQFIGPTNKQPFEVHSNGQRVMRLETPTTSTAAGNVVLGYSGNSVASGFTGATISGGGSSTGINHIAGDYDTIGGGENNVTTGTHSTVVGGLNNKATSDFASVAGGNANIASLGFAAIGGGEGNTASGFFSTVAGGSGNTASNTFSAVGGGNDNVSSAAFSTVAGGDNNTASQSFASVGGGQQNVASNFFSTVAGGDNNTASQVFAAVGGGENNVASGDFSTIAGGQNNQATNTSSAIGGGQGNVAPTFSSTIAGGENNITSGTFAAVGGGQFNQGFGFNTTVAGGDTNLALGQFSAIGGGLINVTTGTFATVPGGNGNSAAGDLSFAAGHRAKANHTGAFVWADSTEADFASTSQNQFIIRAAGGVGINKNNPTTGSLDIAGDLRFDGNIHGKAVSTVTTGGLRTICGVVQCGTSTASVFSGDGFTVSRLSQGSYEVDYSSFFNSFPVVCMTAMSFNGTVDFTAVLSISASSGFVVNIHNVSGALADPDYFHFIVMGP